MSEISTPHNFEFEEIFMNGSWIEASPPPDHPDFKSYVSVSSDESPQFIITTETQKITLDFAVASQIFLDGKIFRYNKNNVLDLTFEDRDSN